MCKDKGKNDGTPPKQTSEKGDYVAERRAANDSRVTKIVPKTARGRVSYQVTKIMADMKPVKGVATLNSFRKGLYGAFKTIEEFTDELKKEGKPRNKMCIQFLLWLAAFLKTMSGH
ncbi:MAG: hypothetical protein N0C84_05720 [Candidatus Thiodiazotropha taylori]|uniref:Uncharacterized protein n=1 Tax=Candidatus Thiodiazotropha taylori TaxID=2792791 RepID=A0A9E4KCK4_9GAMM|nr:hypothetical protein [Candidatus Thiodiazotropha taylori]MCW4255951.1 hypothetical protein [Candidatus Thiodiazotropha taylori]